ncbi:MAG: hypothetical protein F9K38_10150 [Pseudorhodoplanes sp.]|nr:MAG: hypothetical protein F9K38_10150 [Pseudorhodoplanes sp.]MBZ0227885.1 hypothetical protein [Bauldia sp.]
MSEEENSNRQAGPIEFLGRHSQRISWSAAVISLMFSALAVAGVRPQHVIPGLEPSFTVYDGAAVERSQQILNGLIPGPE